MMSIRSLAGMAAAALAMWAAAAATEAQTTAVRFSGTEPLENANGAASWTAVLTPRTVSELKLGAMKFGDVASYPAGSLPTAASLGIQGFTADNPSVPLLPQISFSGTGAPTNIKFGGTASFGEAALSMIQNIYTVNETLTHVAGAHTLKFRYELHREDYNAPQASNAGGQISFAVRRPPRMPPGIRSRMRWT